MPELDLISLFVGYCFCLFCDVVFSAANFFIQRALYYRKAKKYIERDS